MKASTLAVLIVIIFLGAFLRFYRVAQNPPGLYIDEIGIAYNAYTILTTGRDEYNTFLPITFRSFDDYKMPAYIYLTAGSIKLFGKNEFAIRFPSVLAGTLTIGVIFFLLQLLLGSHTSTEKYKDRLSLVGALLFAILPWHLLISRGGFEVTVAMFFYSLGLLLGLVFWQSRNSKVIIGATILFVVSMYTYHSYRIVVPITIIFGIVASWRDNKKRSIVLLAAILFFLLSLPLFIFSFSAHGIDRFAQTSAFGDDAFTGWSRIPVNILIYVKNYYSYFSLTYLFSYGDQINRHQVNNFGLLYIWQLPYIIAGLYFLTRTKNRILRTVLFFLLFVGPIPAALARPSPHSLRFLLGTIVFTTFTVFGFFQLFLQKNKKVVRTIFVMTAIIACVEFTYYTHFYFVQYPKLAIIDWGGNCKDVAEKIGELHTKYKRIYIDKNLGCVAEYFSFYIPDVPVTYVSVNQEIPSSNGKELFVRPYYGSATSTHLVYTSTLKNLNKDVFAEFWQL